MASECPSRSTLAAVDAPTGSGSKGSSFRPLAQTRFPGPHPPQAIISGPCPRPPPTSGHCSRPLPQGPVSGLVSLFQPIVPCALWARLVPRRRPQPQAQRPGAHRADRNDAEGQELLPLAVQLLGSSPQQAATCKAQRSDRYKSSIHVRVCAGGAAVRASEAWNATPPPPPPAAVPAPNHLLGRCLAPGPPPSAPPR